MERKRIEIEAKFPLFNKNEVSETLDNLAKKVETNNIQEDIYYTPKHKNFLKEEPIVEWLRIRNTDQEKTINYKDWRNSNNITCKEIEVAIDDYNGIIEIFKALEFQKIIQVNKIRNSWEYKNIIISIDTLANLGDYIELELKNNLFDNEKDSLDYIKKIMTELKVNVGDQIFAGYPQLIMEKNKEKIEI